MYPAKTDWTSATLVSRKSFNDCSLFKNYFAVFSRQWNTITQGGFQLTTNTGFSGCLSLASLHEWFKYRLSLNGLLKIFFKGLLPKNKRFLKNIYFILLYAVIKKFIDFFSFSFIPFLYIDLNWKISLNRKIMYFLLKQ